MEPFPCGDEVTFVYNGGTVTYGTVESAGGRCWMDRNLGASQVATSSNDVASYGDLFQWGRGADGHQLVNRYSGDGKMTSEILFDLSVVDQPGHGDFIIPGEFPNDWRSPQNDDLSRIIHKNKVLT